jgi:LPS sulfotransferase NodH
MGDKMTDKTHSLSELYSDRKGKYSKPKEDELFLKQLNETLAIKERDLYKQCEINHPFIFIFGLPRSGTTLMSQAIAHCMDVGFINNFMARFYIAPVHGIRLSRLIFGEEHSSSFQSDYARTSEITDIHEFGYFWRYWLKKESFSGVTQAQKIETDIDWQGLRHTLANIQNEFKKPMVFKNIFGSYHIHKLNETLGKTIYIYIKRDLLDSAISILEARKKYNTDLNTWWSYMPVEYESIKHLGYMGQIAGQVYFLKRYYDKISKNLKNVITVNYESLTQSPIDVLKRISNLSETLFERSIPIEQMPPETFSFRTYSKRHSERAEFERLISDLRERYE